MSNGNRRNDSTNVFNVFHHDPLENNNKKPKSADSAHKEGDKSVLEMAGFEWNGGGANSSEHAGGQTEYRWRMEEEEPPSSCCKLGDLKTLSDCEENLGLMRFDGRNAVLVDVQALYNNQGIVPVKGKEVWDENHVKMPNAMRNLMAPNQGPKWRQIHECLETLARQNEVHAKDVENAILHFNPRYRSTWKFDALFSFVKSTPPSENDLNKLFAKIAALALKLPKEVQKAIPLLQRGRSASITLSQVQISCLLANAFFCTFPHRNTSKPTAEYHSYPSINFSSLFGKSSNRKIQKLKAIMHYFRMVTGEGADKAERNGLVTFERRCLRDEDKPCWESCREQLSKLHVTSEGNIEDDGADLLQVDFAAKGVGGGVLDSGLVQEEILFLLHPELIVSRLFMQELGDDECLIVTGLERFSVYQGYSDTFQWAGPYVKRVERDEWKRLKRQIVAIDALHFRDPKQQFHMSAIVRELNKAYCGFKSSGSSQETDIATGKWGCGAFNGDPQLKAVIQLMAAAKARRGLAFFTFHDQKLERELRDVYHLLVTRGSTVGDLYRLLKSFCAEVRRPKHEDLFDFIRKSGSKL